VLSSQACEADSVRCRPVSGPGDDGLPHQPRATDDQAAMDIDEKPAGVETPVIARPNTIADSAVGSDSS